MPIGNITQSVSVIPAPPHRGVDVQTVFVTKQEDFQDHLQGTTVAELNTLKTQINTTVTGMNIAVETINTKASEASVSASSANTSANTATTKASEASTSATSASASASTATTQAGIATTKANEASASATSATTSRNQAETFAQQAQASATSVDANNIVHRTNNESIAGVKTFSSSPIVPTPTTDTQAANKAYVDNATPVGIIITFASSTAPTGYLKCNGANVSRTTYSALWNTIGTTFGVGDGSTTFALPDLRGYFPRGWDDGRGIDTSRAFGSNQGDAYLNHSHTASSVSAGSHTHASAGIVPSSGWSATNISQGLSTAGGTLNSTINATIGSAGAHTHTITVDSSITGSTETRPKNIALLYCIKY